MQTEKTGDGDGPKKTIRYHNGLGNRERGGKKLGGGDCPKRTSKVGRSMKGFPEEAYQEGKEDWLYTHDHHRKWKGEGRPSLSYISSQVRITAREGSEVGRPLRTHRLRSGTRKKGLGKTTPGGGFL